MERAEAIESLRSLVGEDLRELAKHHEVTVWKPNGKMNKGWAGHAVERHLGIPLNSSQSPNLGTWELKVVPMVKGAQGSFKFKETMAITMIDPVEVVRSSFFDSHLYTKLRRIILVTRHRLDEDESASPVLGVYEFKLDSDWTLLRAVKEDYEAVQRTVARHGFDNLTGKMGRYIQPRTKGKGHGSKSRAFYARKCFLEGVIQSQPDLSTRRSRQVSNDCQDHAGARNSVNRAGLDTIMIRLPSNQSGVGRHKCTYCAYRAGYEDAIAELWR